MNLILQSHRLHLGLLFYNTISPTFSLVGKFTSLIFLLKDLQVLFTWPFHENLLSILTRIPKQSEQDLYCITVWPNMIGSKGPMKFFESRIRTSVFSMWLVSWLRSHHTTTSTITFRGTIDTLSKLSPMIKMFVSPEEIYTSPLVIDSGKSWTYIAHNQGPRREPWTPYFMALALEFPIDLVQWLMFDN